MYELVEKIIKKAAEEKVDTGVAYDMLVAENGVDADLKKAHEFFEKNQYEIHQMRKLGMADEIKALCDKADDTDFVRKHLIALYDEGILK
jgi:hypothetical protein